MASIANELKCLLSHQFQYDLIVIGGGSGGLRLSKTAADLGAKVALLDYVKPSTQGSTWKLGGTCVNVGCIPKKQMHFAAEMGDKIREAFNYGWKLPFDEVDESNEDDIFNHFPAHRRQPYFDWNTLVQGVLNTRSGSSFVYNGELRKRKIDYFNALGSLQDSHTVQLSGSFQTITGQYIVLSPGGRPLIPSEIPGALENAITSDDIFALKKAPGKTLVVGGSYIALESAGFLAGLGFDTTVMVRSKVLRHENFDQEVASIVQQHMQDYHHVKFLQPAIPVRIEKLEDGKKLVTFKYADKEGELQDVFDTVMFATGRYADVKGLNLDSVGVQYTKEGKVIVNDEERTSVNNIFAIGDIIENGFNYELTPVAIQQGKYLAWRLFKQNCDKKVDYQFVPTTVFTPIEYGVVGYSEEKAKRVFGADNLMIYKKTFNILEHKIAEKPEKGFVKLICLKNENERVIGLHFVGPNAGEVVQGFVLALKKGCTKEEFDDVIGIHPTNAESFMYLEAGVYEDKTCCG
ncbi:hypothetical protein ABK040_015844 [Willaertia magna]